MLLNARLPVAFLPIYQLPGAEFFDSCLPNPSWEPPAFAYVPRCSGFVVEEYMPSSIRIIL
jgi:hypothetical protein